MSRFTTSIAALLALMLTAIAAAATGALERIVTVDIGAQPLSTALIEFSKQAGVQVITPAAKVSNLETRGVRGEMSLSAALEELLKGTNLGFHAAGDNTIGLDSVTQNPAAAVAADISVRLAQTGEPFPSKGEGQDKGKNYSSSEGFETQNKGIPEVLVKGSRSLNVDIQRTEDDIQPYVVFDSEDIKRSPVPDLESFLKVSLSMNAASQVIGQLADSPQNNSGLINLRGLGTQQTLILVDGRRLPSPFSLSGDLLQPSISGIPLSSIERIEVLPTTSGGIYGGNATGGVINIIRKHNYSGVDVEVKYANTFDAAAPGYDVNVSGGFIFKEDGPRLSFSASHSKQDPLYMRDRDFARRSRGLLVANNPALIESAILPPVSSTANFCAATTFQYEGRLVGLCSGEALVLDNGTPFGSSFGSVPSGYAGPSSDGSAALIGNAGAYNLQVPNSGQVLLRSPTRDSVALNFRQQIFSDLEFFADATADRSLSDLSESGLVSIPWALPADSPNNPFQQDIGVVSNLPYMRSPAESKYETRALTVGLIARLPRNWAGTVEAGKIRTKTSFKSTRGLLLSSGGLSGFTSRLQDNLSGTTDVTPFLLPVPDTFGGPFDSDLAYQTLRASGPILNLPGGEASVSASIERLKNSVPDSFLEQKFSDPVGTPAQVTLYPHRSRRQQSYYLETTLPVIGPSQGFLAVHGFDLQASVRYDDYRTITTSNQPQATSTEGPFAASTYFTNDVSSTAYTYGFRYQPLVDISLRASVGTGFVAPELSQITPYSYEQTFPNADPIINPPDPRRGGTPLSTPRVEFAGGNPLLNPETSRSWSAGVVLTPRFLDGSRLSIDYVHMKKRGEIVTPTLQLIINAETTFPERVVRGPSLPGDLPGWAGPVTQIDGSLINIADTLMDAIDLKSSYKWQSEKFGSFQAVVAASRMLKLERRTLPTTESFDTVGYFDGPLRWRGSANLMWTYGSWETAWSAEYYDSYSVAYSDPGISFVNPGRISNQGATSIPSQTYHNLYVKHVFQSAGFDLLNDVSIMVGIQNVFNTSPPILAAFGIDTVGPGVYSNYGDPKLRRYSLAMTKSF